MHINICRVGGREDGARLFPVVPSDRTRGNGHKLKPGTFQLNTRKNFFPLRVPEPWPRLAHQQVSQVPSAVTGSNEKQRAARFSQASAFTALRWLWSQVASGEVQIGY